MAGLAAEAHDAQPGVFYATRSARQTSETRTGRRQRAFGGEDARQQGEWHPAPIVVQ